MENAVQVPIYEHRVASVRFDLCQSRILSLLLTVKDLANDN
jgi:hypothetical protein